MSIKRLLASNFLVFKGGKGGLDGTFALHFCSGINILMGGNGVGKTSILKMLYAVCEWSDQKSAKMLADFFGPSAIEDQLTSFGSARGSAFFRVETEGGAYQWGGPGAHPYGKSGEERIQSVFIPTTEMLSHAKGFLALNEKFAMPFDRTQVDIIVNAELPETREVSALHLGLLEQLGKVIGGEVIFEDDAFYIRKSDGHKVDFSMEAEGMRKFALLWKLLRNGLLSPGSILFWDEPEANINPELLPVLVEILLALQRGGVQIFLATHSYHLARYFDAVAQRGDMLRYFVLHRDGDEIIPASASRYTEIAHNPLERAGEQLYQAVVARASEDAADGS